MKVSLHSDAPATGAMVRPSTQKPASEPAPMMRVMRSIVVFMVPPGFGSRRYNRRLGVRSPGQHERAVHAGGGLVIRAVNSKTAGRPGFFASGMALMDASTNDSFPND